MALTLVAAAAGVCEFHDALPRTSPPGPESQTAAAVGADLSAPIREQRLSRPRIKLDQDAWGIAASVILRLQKWQVPVAVEDDRIVMFTPAFAATAREPAVLTIAGKLQHIRTLDAPGDGVVVSRDRIYVHLARSAGR